VAGPGGLGVKGGVWGVAPPPPPWPIILGAKFGQSRSPD